MKKRLTAAELLAKLSANPHWVARRNQREAQIAEAERRSRQIQKSLADDLRKVGLEVESAWDLVNTSAPYPRALPVLLEHLQRPYPPAEREGMARALAVREARFAWPLLVALYCREPAERVKHGLAAALAVIADNSALKEIISLARDPSNGDSRVILLRALSRSRRPEARLALEEFADEPTLHKEAQNLLKSKTRRKKNRLSGTLGRGSSLGRR